MKLRLGWLFNFLKIEEETFNREAFFPFLEMKPPFYGVSYPREKKKNVRVKIGKEINPIPLNPSHWGKHKT